MNKFATLLLLSISVCVGTNSAGAAESSKALAAALDAAIKAKDINAAVKLVAWEQAPIMAHRFFRMSIADCAIAANCKVEVAEMSAEEKQPQQDYFFATPPEGQLKLVSPEDTEGFSMPFAKVGAEYKIILGQQTEESYAQSKAAADAKKLAEELELDVVSTGQGLPAGGGDPAAAYTKYITAIKDGDTAYLGQQGTQSDKYFFGDAYKDNAIKNAINLELARMENIAQPVVKGGFIKDNKAVLMVSGTNGLGWITEGAVLLLLTDGKWTMEDKFYASYSPK